MRSKEFNQFLVFQAASNKFSFCHSSISVDIHSFENALSSGFRALELIHCNVIRAHHIINGFDDFGHFWQIYVAVTVDVIHAVKEYKNVSQARQECKGFANCQHQLETVCHEM